MTRQTKRHILRVVLQRKYMDPSVRESLMKAARGVSGLRTGMAAAGDIRRSVGSMIFCMRPAGCGGDPDGITAADKIRGISISELTKGLVCRMQYTHRAVKEVFG